jgi:uncharacterized protein (UPF0276 family)
VEAGVSFLGAGIGYRHAYRNALLGGGPRPSVLDVIPDHFFADPDALAALATYPIVFHEVAMSIGTADDGRLARAMIDRIRSLVDIAKPVLFSDHVAITRSPSGVDLGHLCPIWHTRDTFVSICDRIRAWEDIFGVPIALENIAAPFMIPDGDMTEPQLFCELVAATGCGMLLDITNLIANAHNFGFDPVTRVAEYPLEAVVQVHLAGGVVHKGFWVDSHSEPVADASYELLVRVRERASKLVTIIVERDNRLPPLAELVAESRRAELAWTSGGSTLGGQS